VSAAAFGRSVRAGFVLALGAAWLGAVPAAAEPGARQVPLPAGLASAWRIDGRKADARAWSLAAFSTDGELVGIADETGIRVYRAADGRVVRTFPVPFATGQFAHSLAISSTGLVAVGGVEVHSLASDAAPCKFYCARVCGSVSVLAFSPDGAWLAYQAARGRPDATPGVVDVRAGVRAVALEASATRAGVLFAADGASLIAASTTEIDATGEFGVRRFDAAAHWQRTRDIAGVPPPLGSIGPFAFNERMAAYTRDGNLELREVASGALVWSVPLAPPGLDSPSADSPTKLELAAFFPRGDLVLTFESPVAGGGPGALVLRRTVDGAVVASYDVVGVSALAVAPDGQRFLYMTGVGRTYTTLARVPARSLGGRKPCR
jgi:hypothetical protein